WYTGADTAAISADQYDFETIVMHELGHAIGLGHSGDTGSVMYAYLAPGQARRGVTAQELTGLERGGEGARVRLRADALPAPSATPLVARGSFGGPRCTKSPLSRRPPAAASSPSRRPGCPHAPRTTPPTTPLVLRHG